MTTLQLPQSMDLTPTLAAQAVLDAVVAAAALRAVVQQIDHSWDGAECIDFLQAIAAELEAAMTTDFRALCAEVIAYNEGQSPYNFSDLNGEDRDNAAYDAWVELREEIKAALAVAANDCLTSAN